MKWKKIEMIARRMWRGEKMELKKEDWLYDTKGLVWWESGEMAAVGCGGMTARAMCALWILQQLCRSSGAGG